MFVARIMTNSNPYSSTIEFPSSSMNPLLCRSFKFFCIFFIVRIFFDKLIYSQFQRYFFLYFSIFVLCCFGIYNEIVFISFYFHFRVDLFINKWDLSFVSNKIINYQLSLTWNLTRIHQLLNNFWNSFNIERIFLNIQYFQKILNYFKNILNLFKNILYPFKKNMN